MDIVLLIGGGALIFFGIAMLRSQFSGAKAERLTGEVFGFIRDEKQKDMAHFYPVVSFQWKGEEKFLKGGIGSMHPRYKIGQKIEVKIFEGEKLHAEIEGKALRIVAGILILAGVVVTVIFFLNFKPNVFNLAISVFIVFQTLFAKNIGPKNYTQAKVKMGALADRHFAPGILSTEELLDLTLVEPGMVKKIYDEHALLTRRVGFALILAGALSSGLSFHWHLKRQQFLSKARFTTGMVVRLEESRSDDSYTYHPIVQYRHPASSAPVEFKHPAGASPPSFDVGEGVKILYANDSPYEAMIDEGMQNQLFPILCMIFSILLSALGLKMSKKPS